MISLILFDDKEDTLVLVLSSFVALFWEAFIEPFGWYFKLWEFAKLETDPVIVWEVALQLGLEFYAFYYLLGMFYLIIYKKDSPHKYHMIFTLLIVMTILGWLGDINIAMFNTYVLTFFVWLILNILHVIGVIKIYDYFDKKRK